jgi:hypothetical protein
MVGPPCSLDTTTIQRLPGRAGVAERADQFVGRRQIGGIGDAHQNHFGGGHGPAGSLHFGDALSSICQVRDNTRIDKFCVAKARPRTRSASDSDTSSAVAGTIFHAGDEMGEFGKIAQHHAGIGAGIVLVAQFLEARGDVAAHQRLEQIDDTRAVGQAQHLRARLRHAPDPPACAIA